MKDQENGRNSNKVPSWLPHILPARNPEEQNLEVVVKAGQLYFRASRDIRVGEELRAWFGQDLAEILKLPMIPPTSIDGKHFCDFFFLKRIELCILMLVLLLSL